MLSCYFPIWSQLSAEDQVLLTAHAQPHHASRGTILHNGDTDCLGLAIVRNGQLRASLISDEGREITLYRLFEQDICLFSASCMLQNIQFAITIEAEKDCDLWVIPPDIFRRVMLRSAALANYTNQLLSSRFTEVMWLVEQILWRSLDRRLAAFLLEESNLEDSDTLHLTHERIAQHLGSAREVVTRMLRYFQSEGWVRLARGTIQLTDLKALTTLIE